MPTIAIIDSFPVLRKGLIILLRNQFKKTDFMEAGQPCELACTTGRRKCPDLLILGLNEKRQHEFHAILSEVKHTSPLHRSSSMEKTCVQTLRRCIFGRN